MSILQVFEANFSTTTPNDRLVSQLILMSSVQKYFNFNTYIACGIPEVRHMAFKPILHCKINGKWQVKLKCRSMVKLQEQI